MSLETDKLNQEISRDLEELSAKEKYENELSILYRAKLKLEEVEKEATERYHQAILEIKKKYATTIF